MTAQMIFAGAGTELARITEKDQIVIKVSLIELKDQCANFDLQARGLARLILEIAQLRMKLKLDTYTGMER